jgi:hypothetical protein
LSGQWAGVKTLPPNVVRTIANLVAGGLDLEYLPYGDHYSSVLYRSASANIAFRIRRRHVINSSMLGQEPGSLVPFAASLLLANKSGFPKAYIGLLAALAARRPQAELDAAMQAAGAALMSGCKRSLGTDTAWAKNRLFLVWFYAVKVDDGQPEMSDRGLKIAPLLSSLVEYTAYIAGRSKKFGTIKIKWS